MSLIRTAAVGAVLRPASDPPVAAQTVASDAPRWDRVEDVPEDRRDRRHG